MKRLRYLLLILVVLLIAGGLAYWRLIQTPIRLQTTVDTPLPSKGSPEEELRRSVLGTWQDNYEGKRTMTLNTDGTGTMLVELSGMKATLFADKLRFDMRWSLEGKKLIKTTIGGEPLNKVNMVINMMGDTAEDTIVEVSADRLLLLDKNGKTQYDWRRVKP